MTLRGIFSYNQLDSTSDMNSHLARIIDRGIFYGGVLSLSGTSLQITIPPFIAVGYDGMVVTSDASTTVTIPAGNNYLVCHARWLSGSAPYIVIKTVTESNWLTSSDRYYYITFAKLVVPLGATYINSSYVSYSSSDYADVLGKSPWRPRVSAYSLLPSIGNRHGDIRVANDRAYQWDSVSSTWISLLTNDMTDVILNNWTKRISPVPGTIGQRGIAINEKNIVIVGQYDSISSAAIYVSHDNGIKFSKVTAAAYDLYSVAVMDVSGSPVFVAVGSSSIAGGGIIIASVDNGDTWSTVTTTPSSLNKVKVFAGTTMVAVGENNGIFYSTDPAVSWSDYTSSVFLGGLTDITSNGVNNWITGVGGSIYQNPDISIISGWTEVLAVGTSTAYCDYGNSMYVVGGRENVYISNDSINFSIIGGVLPTDYEVSTIKYCPAHRKFLMFGVDTTGLWNGVTYHTSISGAVWDDLSGSVDATRKITDVDFDARDTPYAINFYDNLFMGFRA